MSPKFPIPSERIEQAAALWSDGLSTSQISKKMGIPKATICTMAFRHRDLFPKRQEYNRPIPKVSAIRPVLTLVPKAPDGRTFFEGRWIEHVKRTTQSGAVVTMPRVSFIDGIREGGD